MNTETIKLVADVAFMATSAGMSKVSNNIFSAIETIRPNSVLPIIGQSLNYMNSGFPEKALNLLDKKALKVEPDSDTAKVFKGMALMMLGRNKEAEQQLVTVTKSQDDMAKRLASELLLELKNYQDNIAE